MSDFKVVNYPLEAESVHAILKNANFDASISQAKFINRCIHEVQRVGPHVFGSEHINKIREEMKTKGA